MNSQGLRFRTFHSWCAQVQEAFTQKKHDQNLYLEFYKWKLEDENINGFEWLSDNHKNQMFVNQQFNQILLAQVRLAHLQIMEQNNEQFFIDFCQQLQKYFLIMKPTFHYVMYVIRLLFEMNKKYRSFDTNLFVLCIDSLKSQLDHLTLDQLVLLFYQTIQLKLIQYNLSLYFEFYKNLITAISSQINNCTNLNLKSLYYSVGKIGMYDDALSEFLLRQFHSIKVNDDESFQVAINLGLCVTNILDVDPRMYFKTIFNYLKLNPKNQQYQLFYTMLIRCNIYDQEYWEMYFSNNYQDDTYISIQIKLNLCLFVDEFPQSIQDLIRKQILPLKDSLEQSIIPNVDYDLSHPLEVKIAEELKLRGLEFQTGVYVMGNEIDIIIPSKNLIIEIMGATHFSFDLNAMNGFTFYCDDELILLAPRPTLVTKHKLKKLKQIGYDVKTITFFDMRKKCLQLLVDDLLS